MKMQIIKILYGRGRNRHVTNEIFLGLCVLVICCFDFSPRYCTVAFAQKPFAHRIGIGAMFGHSQLVGEMNDYLQGDFAWILRVKYNFSETMAIELSGITHKKFLNRIKVPEIPVLQTLDTPEDVNLTGKFTPILLNVNYYLSRWDTKPYASVGIGYYSVSSDMYVHHLDNGLPANSVFTTSDQMIGMNIGGGMETFLLRSLTFELKAALHILRYTAPATGETFQFPIDNPRFATFVVGITYYFK